MRRARFGSRLFEIAYQGSENEVTNWKRPSRKSWPPCDDGAVLDV